MTSTGNDIVALKNNGAVRSKNTRFYSKIMSTPEIEFYQANKFPGLPFENYVWLLWSVKEAVYKYQQRNFPATSFSPKKIIVNNIIPPQNIVATKFGVGQYESCGHGDEDCYSSIIHFGPYNFYGKSIIHDELIHTVANCESNFENIWWGVKFIDSSDYEIQSKAVRRFAIDKLSAIFKNDNLAIEKSAAGYPVLLKEAVDTAIPVSFSHHGNYIGYSFLLGGVE